VAAATVTVRPRPLQPQPEPEPEPAPEPEPTPAWHVLAYQGYRTTVDGVEVALIRNLTTGQLAELPQGRKFLGMMVAGFTGTELILLTPTGQERVLKVDQKLRIPAP
jgi:hypothetical protein